MYGTADWVDPSDPAQGIICRELLHLGEKIATAVPATPEEIAKLTHGRMKSALPPAEVSGCKFVPPPTQRNETLPRLQLEELRVAVQNWDWATASLPPDFRSLGRPALPDLQAAGCSKR